MELEVQPYVLAEPIKTSFWYKFNAEINKVYTSDMVIKFDY